MKSKNIILIVDDDMDIIVPLKSILEQSDFEVVEAYDTEEAFEKLETVTPDLIISDVMMKSHYEGFEFAKKVKTDPKTANIPVIIQSSIEVLTTTNPSIQPMIHELRNTENVQKVADIYRNDSNYRDMKVLLIKDMASGKAGIDYLSEDGVNKWVDVDNFIPKPVAKDKLLKAIKYSL